MVQQTLFDNPTHARAPFARGSATSEAAAVAIQPQMNPLQAAVLDAIRARGEYGATDQEIEEATGLSGNTVRPRRGELKAAGRIQEAAFTRKTKSNRDASVWIARS